MPKPPGRVRVRRAFTRTLRELRVRAGLSQEELAHQAGIDRAHVCKLERGIKMPSYEIVTRLVSPLGVSFTEFAAEFENRLHGCR